MDVDDIKSKIDASPCLVAGGLTLERDDVKTDVAAERDDPDVTAVIGGIGELVD